MRSPALLLALASLTLAACAPQARPLASIPTRPRPTWAFQASDVPVDPAFRFGQLPNGMRYVIRRNATPQGTASVRMEVDAGSLDETDSELGYAHFVEHMAFNGSTHVPEGEMVRLLERDGLAFGADTNAQTAFQNTLYMLDLPRNDFTLLDTALMLMRETASELKFDPAAVDRERGVVLSEMRDGNTYAFRNIKDQFHFLGPQARFPKRFPIGTAESVGSATAAGLKAFWQREYVPAHVTVIVIGDFDPAQVEARIVSHFGDWQARPAEPQPNAGPVDPRDKGRTDIYVDPALAERVTASRPGAWLDEIDTTAQRRENLLRQIGYAIVNRRLLRITRQPNPPFRGAGLGTMDVFKTARITNLVVDTSDGGWRRGLMAAAAQYHRALASGFTTAEVAEQVAQIRTASRIAAAGEDTRSNHALVNAVLSLLRDDNVPSTPQSSLERLEAFIPSITPKAVLAALKREALPLKDPLLRFQGKKAPEGGAAAVRSAWNKAQRTAAARAATVAQGKFAYTDFGTPGTVVSDAVEPLLGIREVRFANGVRLNLKHTDLEKDRVTVQVSVDGGDRLATKQDPLAVELVPMIPEGGLGKHSQDELQSLLAGHTVGTTIASTPETFAESATTTPDDLELQLDLFTALLTDPGYRHEGEERYRLNINNFFAQLDATPRSALSGKIGNILSDDDPRFSVLKPDAYRTLTFAALKQDISERLGHGAIEIGVVGDIDEAKTIALVAKTFGALPPREPDFRRYPEQRQRPFTAQRGTRIVRHTGAPDQALVRYTWPTRDDSDPVAHQQFELLEQVVRIELTENLREKLGKSYSPSASSNLTRSWDNYGTFSITAGVDVKDIPATRASIAETLADLRDKPVDPDILQRARQPMLEAYDNALKSNRGWITLVDRAQTEADEIERFVHAKERLSAVTAGDIQALARRYLAPKDAVEVLVIPQGAEAPK